MKRPTLVLLAVLASGCGTPLLNSPVSARSTRWELAVRGVTDGPDSINVSPMLAYKADDGDRFLHLSVSLRNVSERTQKWNWPRCSLDLGDREYLPRLVMLDSVMAMVAEGTLEIRPGELIERQVIFPYPEGKTLPTHLTCGEVVVPLKLQPS